MVTLDQQVAACVLAGVRPSRQNRRDLALKVNTTSPHYQAFEIEVAGGEL